MKEIKTLITTEADSKIRIDQCSDVVWLSLGSKRGSMHTPLTRAEAEQMIANLQAVLAKVPA